MSPSQSSGSWNMHFIHLLMQALFYSISSTGFVHKGATKYFSFFILSLLKKDPAFKSLTEYPLLAQCLFVDLAF